MSRKTQTASATPSLDEPRVRQPDTFLQIPLAETIPNTWNPRRSINPASQAELVASIREVGIIEPLIVRPAIDRAKLVHAIGGSTATDGYEVVAGMRRHAAAVTLALPTVPCLVKDLTSTEALEFALTENLQRLDMHPLDEAEAFKTLQASEPRLYTVAKIAARVGQTESHVYRRLRLLDLEEPLRVALAEDRLSLGHAERLLRLDPKRRKEAADPVNGVVWGRSPLLDYHEKWTPTREDLRPLNELEKFIRDKTHFDPSSEDTKHFQPALASAIEHVVEDDLVDSSTDAEETAVRASLVELSEDPMARMRMGAKPGDPIPLTPSKWREVTSEKQRCPFTIRGVITHGGPPRVLDVCTKKSCQKHFPVAKKKPTATRGPAEPKARPSWEIENEKRERESKAWEALKPQACAGLVAHLKAAKVKFNAALLRAAISQHDVKRIETDFGIKLTDDTAAVLLALSTVSTWDRQRFLDDVKAWKFNLGSIEQKHKAAEKKAAAADARAKPAKKGKKAA